MPAPIELLTPGETLSRLASILDCPQETQAIREAAIAEYIRACVYGPCHYQDEWGPPRSVHTRTVLSLVRRRANFLWGDADHGSIDSRGATSHEGDKLTADVLVRLGMTGDLVELGAGYWAPGPVRLVRAFHSGMDALLVSGGVPTEALQLELAARLSAGGCGRFMRPSRATLRRLQIQEDSQSVLDWLGSPSESLAAWTRRVLRSLAATMNPMPDADVADCEVYAPEPLPGKPRHQNWVRIRELSLLPDGLRLCRPSSGRSASYDRPTYIAVLSNDHGRPVFHRMTLVPNDHLVRLMLGFDQMKGIRRTVTLEVGSGVCRAAIPFRLPDPESRMLAFGWATREPLKRTGTVLGFPSDLAPFLRNVLKSLNIDCQVRPSTEMGL